MRELSTHWALPLKASTGPGPLGVLGCRISVWKKGVGLFGPLSANLEKVPGIELSWFIFNKEPWIRYFLQCYTDSPPTQGAKYQSGLLTVITHWTENNLKIQKDSTSCTLKSMLFCCNVISTPVITTKKYPYFRMSILFNGPCSKCVIFWSWAHTHTHTQALIWLPEI